MERLLKSVHIKLPLPRPNKRPAVCRDKVLRP
jgi:hypothetical protein